MRVCAVICEYNPLHSGHAYHLAQARARSGADYVLCLMSGPLTQRGTFARHDKWTRAHMALLSGADLVLELPARFACAPAQEFAGGGIRLLGALNTVTHLSFGCEPDVLPHLDTALHALFDETPTFKTELARLLGTGISYPRARAQAAAFSVELPQLALLMANPNAALALEYLHALPKTILPVPIAREGSGYHDTALSSLSSATAVRGALQSGCLADALAATPCPDLLLSAETRGDIHEEESLTQALLYAIRTSSPEALKSVVGMDEGLEGRLFRAAQSAQTREALLAAVKTKRYTHARLSRLCAHVLLHETRTFAKENTAPTYARVLGFRQSAVPLLAAIKRQSSIPLVTKAADFDRSNPLFALDLRAQDLWSLGCKNPSLRACGRDFTTSPVRL